MLYYLLRRLAGAVAVLFGVVTGTFILSHVVPSCPACAVAGLRAGPEQIKAARDSGLGPALDVAMLCVEGENRAGIGYQIMSCLAVAGIDLRGISISQVSHRFAAYLAFDSPDTATTAIQVLATID